MTKIKIYSLLSIITVVYCSCGVSGPQINLYGPPSRSNDIAYQPKPMSSDTVHHATYLSGSYFQGSPPNSKDGSDEISGGQLNIGQGYTFDGFNVAYGAFGTLGGYRNQTNNDGTQPNYFYSKAFGNLGGRFSANAFVTSGRVDIRIIGFEMAYTHEFGDFLDFRKGVTGQPNYFTDTRSETVTMGGTSEIIWRSANHPWQFGLRLFIGQTVGDNRYKNPNSFTTQYYPQNTPVYLAYFMQVKQAFFIGEINPNGGQLRVGLRF